MFARIALTAIAVLAGSLGASAQDAEAGAKVFRTCNSCHQIGQGARHRTGPVLTGVVGRPAGSMAGFRYSNSMVEAGAAGLVWTEELLLDYLANPTAFLRRYLGDGTARAKMTFRLADEKARRDVIAFLLLFNTSAAEARGDAGQGRLCVRNRDARAHLFAVEAGGEGRRLGWLEPGQVLCTEAAGAEKGVVSVYEHADALEGCSRIVPAGETEDMLKYVEFDRCFWSSNS